MRIRSNEARQGGRKGFGGLLYESLFLLISRVNYTHWRRKRKPTGTLEETSLCEALRERLARWNGWAVAFVDSESQKFGRRTLSGCQGVPFGISARKFTRSESEMCSLHSVRQRNSWLCCPPISCTEGKATNTTSIWKHYNLQTGHFKRVTVTVSESVRRYKRAQMARLPLLLLARHQTRETEGEYLTVFVTDNDAPFEFNPFFFVICIHSGLETYIKSAVTNLSNLTDH